MAAKKGRTHGLNPSSTKRRESIRELNHKGPRGSMAEGVTNRTAKQARDDAKPKNIKKDLVTAGLAMMDVSPNPIRKAANIAQVGALAKKAVTPNLEGKKKIQAKYNKHANTDIGRGTVTRLIQERSKKKKKKTK